MHLEKNSFHFSQYMVLLLFILKNENVNGESSIMNWSVFI